MRFGRLSTSGDEAIGAVSAHTLRIPGAVFKKGRVLTADDLGRLRAAGFDSVIAARLDPDDIAEDAAAARLGAAVAGSGLRVADAATGRCNLYAEIPGVLQVDSERVDHLNRIDEAVTLATIAPYSPVRAGDMVATVKLIPFAVPAPALDRCLAAADGSLISIAPFRPRRMGLVLTQVPSVPSSILDRAASAQRVRAERLGSTIARELRCPHDEESLATALRELLAAGCSPILVLGSSAIVDRRDVIPAALERIGGSILHFGMPVDPGNLLLLGRHGDTPVLGVPGCARSLRRSGFDWVLERLCAGLSVSRDDLMGLGVGGLLGEILLRPQPRGGEPAAHAPASDPELTQESRGPSVAALVLAAGLSSRMGTADGVAVNKLLVELDGKPLVAHTVDALLATAARPIVVVTGHDADPVRLALAGRDVEFVHNPDFAAGLSTSLRAGLAHLGSRPARSIDGALVCLGDMPRVRPAHLEALLGAFDPDDGRAIVVPTFAGQRGNPILWARRFFPEMAQGSGDVGARALLGRHADLVCAVPMDDEGVSIDVDTPEALKALCPT